MTLKRFSLALLSCLLVCITTLLVTIYYVFYLPGIKSEILDQQQHEYSLLQSVITLSKESVTTICYDYAVWGESVNYVLAPNQKFVEDNLAKNSLEAANIDAVFIYTADKKLLWHYQDKSLQDMQPQLLSMFKDTVDPKLALLPSTESIAAKVASSRNGYIILNGRLIFYTNTTILPASGKGDVVGSLTMMRLVDQKVVKEVSDFSLVDFSINVLRQDNAHNSLPFFFENKPLTSIVPSRHWVIRNPFNTEYVVLTINHKKSQSPQLELRSAILLILFVIFMVVITLVVLSKLLIRPLVKFNKGINESYSDGLASKVRDKYFIDEIENVSYSFNQLLVKFNAQQNYLESLTVQDALTGITNRRGLEAYAARAFARWIAEGVGFSLIMIDVDRFKLFNDTNGHVAGDNALIRVATQLMKSTQQLDALASRYGGEEFCVMVLSNDQAEITALAEHVRFEIEALHIENRHDNSEWLTISLGVLIVKDHVPHASQYQFNDLLKRADDKLYLAKQAGRNRAIIDILE